MPKKLLPILPHEKESPKKKLENTKTKNQNDQNNDTDVGACCDSLAVHDVASASELCCGGSGGGGGAAPAAAALRVTRLYVEILFKMKMGRRAK